MDRARYEATEAISVAFVTALQLLPPRQRAVLILRDALGFRAAEAAKILDSTEESVTSALKRARAALQYQRAQSADRKPPPPDSQPERELVRRFARANGQPAFGLYVREPLAPIARASGILVLTLADRQISAVTGFPDSDARRIFGLPRMLPVQPAAD